MSFSWTAERCAEAERLYMIEGYSASQVAVEIGAPSRNSVIGKLHQMGIRRPSASAPKVCAPYPQRLARVQRRGFVLALGLQHLRLRLNPNEKTTND